MGLQTAPVWAMEAGPLQPLPYCLDYRRKDDV